MKRFTMLALIAVALVCSAAAVQAQNVEIPLLPELDLIGDQIEVVQGFYLEGESFDQMYRITYGIYDTGASVVTLSYYDQLLFELAYGSGSQIPIKVFGGAAAEGVDGPIIGDVSQPLSVVSDGLHALQIDPNNIFNSGIVWNNPAVVPGIQLFVGTESGSASLPTISGTPMHYSMNHVGGGAARIDKQGYSIDLHEWFPELIPESMPYYMADLQFVDSGTRLQAPDPGSENVIGPFRVPLTMIGGDNYSNPGNEITYTANPFVSNVGLTMETDTSSISVAGKNFLFDTGAMISVISTETAQALGLDPDSGPYSIDISGAAGAAITVYGHSLSRLELPYENYDGASGLLQFTDVPIFVLDVGEGIDGILGMNLFNMASEMLYDPHDPSGASLQLIFDLSERETPLPYDPDSLEYLLMSSLYPALYCGYLPGYGLSSSPVPEPATFALLTIGASLFGLLWIVRRRRISA